MSEKYRTPIFAPRKTSGVVLLLFLVGLAVATVSAAIPTLNLIASWRADGDAVDNKNGNNGTLVGGATFDTGIIGQAFKLDGINDAVVIPETTVNLDGFSALTLAAWINLDSFRGGGAMECHRDEIQYEYFRRYKRT